MTQEAEFTVLRGGTGMKGALATRAELAGSCWAWGQSTQQAGLAQIDPQGQETDTGDLESTQGQAPSQASQCCHLIPNIIFWF